MGTTTSSAPACRICGGTSGKRFSANGFEWLDCAKCGTVQKTLTHQQYLALNPTYDPGAYLDSSGRNEIERFLRIEETTKVIDTATRQYVTSRVAPGARRTFLDVGCGMGGYLLAAQKLGFDVLGFEPSASHARVATKHLNLPVVADYFSRERIGGRKFDLIMLSHVVEHIYSPKAFLKDLVSILKPGGALVVVTPNSDSLVASVTGRLWPMLRPVDHVTLISAKTYAYFDLQGIADVRHWYSEHPYEFAATLGAALKARLRDGEAVGSHLRVNTRAAAGRNASSGSDATSASAPPPLRELSLKARVLKMALTAASAPAWLLASATQRRACLNTVIVPRPMPLGRNSG